MKKSILLFSLLLGGNILSFGQQGQSDFKSVYISKVPKPTAPAVLEMKSIKFSDKDGNNDNILDALETGEISFELSNKGKGDAYNLVIEVSEESSIRGLSFTAKQYTDNLQSGKSLRVKIPLTGGAELATGKAKLRIKVIEANGFDSDPAELTFYTQAFKSPELKIVDYVFSNNESEGKITLGQKVNLRMIIQNRGQGEAKDVVVSLTNPENVFNVDETSYRITSLKPNEDKKINYEFLPNKRYVGKEIPIEVEVKEGYGKYGVKSTLTVSLDQTLAKTLQVDIDAERKADVAISDVSLNSDVDRNIPVNKTIYKSRYALIIGNEDYSKYQAGLNSESNVEFATNDAKTFKEYCNKTLGVPETNIFYFTNATAGTMNQEIDKLNKIIKNSNGEAEVVFYYAGHGLPDEQSKEAYIFPVDVNGSDVRSAIRLQDIYSKLSEFPCKRITVFLDACFTGGGRNQGLLAARMVKTKPAAEVLSGNLVVFTASSGAESSLPWKEKQHGLFTYFVLKTLQQSKGDVGYKELYDLVNKEVKLKSVVVNNKEQSPNLLISNQISSDWQKWKMN